MLSRHQENLNRRFLQWMISPGCVDRYISVKKGHRAHRCSPIAGSELQGQEHPLSQKGLSPMPPAFVVPPGFLRRLDRLSCVLLRIWEHPFRRQAPLTYGDVPSPNVHPIGQWPCSTSYRHYCTARYCLIQLTLLCLVLLALTPFSVLSIWLSYLFSLLKIRTSEP